MKKTLSTTALILGSVLGLAILTLVLFFRFGIYHPTDPEAVEVHQLNDSAKPLGVSFKVLSYNVQYFAGKDYVFFYDLEGFSGPDIRPSTESIEATLDSIAALILKENPDVVLLQEVDENSKRTDHKDQTKQLLERLGESYPYYAETYYWKAAFVPHPKIAGSVGMKLTTLSKAPIQKAIRHQLPRIKENFIARAFNFKRAILETHIAGPGGRPLVFLNTHLDAFAHSPTTMLKQVQKVDHELSRLEETKTPWIIGGDFNLLPPINHETFSDTVSASYSESTELALLYEKYSAIPSLTQLQSPTHKSWLTHFPNNPAVTAPDRTIDYLFYGSQIILRDQAAVLQGETWKYSDHLPLIATFGLAED